MADFCKQCTKDLFGAKYSANNDFVGLTKQEDWEEGLSVVVLCEGCGPIQVDPVGCCISQNCFKRHGKKEEKEDGTNNLTD